MLSFSDKIHNFKKCLKTYSKNCLANIKLMGFNDQVVSASDICYQPLVLADSIFDENTPFANFNSSYNSNSSSEAEYEFGYDYDFDLAQTINQNYLLVEFSKEIIVSSNPVPVFEKQLCSQSPNIYNRSTTEVTECLRTANQLNLRLHGCLSEIIDKPDLHQINSINKASNSHRHGHSHHGRGSTPMHSSANSLDANIMLIAMLLSAIWGYWVGNSNAVPENNTKSKNKFK